MTSTKPIIESDVPAIREPIPTPPATGNVDPLSLVFKDDFAFVDTETTGIDPDVDAIVEIAIVRMRAGEMEVFHTLVNPGFPIPPTASAVHGITDDDVKDSPRIEDLQDRIIEMLDGAYVYAHNAAFDANFVDPAAGLDPAPKEWTCTYRLSRHLFKDAPAHGNQVLRYWLKTQPKTEGLGAHRAIDDVYVSIENMRHMLRVCQERGMTTLGEVQALSNETIIVDVMPFGKHANKTFAEIPADYFEWALANLTDLDEDLKVSMEKELERKATQPPMPVTSLPFGMHRDKPLSDVPTDYLEWIMNDRKNGGPKPAIAAGVTLELERRRAAGVRSEEAVAVAANDPLGDAQPAPARRPRPR